jgi:membrane-bound inhibitor of C-type lysozyme
MLLICLIVLGALLFVGAGHAAAAQRSTAPHRTVAVHHRAVAYADGQLTVARHNQRERTVVAHTCTHPVVVVANVAQKTPVAYADGLLTVARHHKQHRRILAHAA